MNFESMLAKRYILSQKKHSILTICSIIIAVSLMTMIFTGGATIKSIERDIIYDENPFHMRIYSVTPEQVEIIKSEPEVKSIKYGDEIEKKEALAISDRSDNQKKLSSKTIDIMFNEDIGDIMIVANRIFKDVGLDIDFYNDNYEKFEVNRDLLNLDCIDDEGHFVTLALYCEMFIFAIFIAISLRLIIDTAFEISSKEREKQFGILQSIGATPKQIVRIITFEGFILSIIGIPLGLLMGVGLGYLAFRKVVDSGTTDIFFSTKELAEKILIFRIPPLMLLLSAATGLVWILLSAYGTGMRIIRKSPLEAINARTNTVKRVRKFSIYGLLTGWTGRLAVRNNHRQPKRFIITILSLSLSIALFASVTTVTNIVSDFMNEVFSYIESDMEISFVKSSDKISNSLYYKQPLQQLMNSGFFKDFDYRVSASMGTQVTEKSEETGEKKKQFMINYVSEDAYNNIMKENKIENAASFEEFTKSGKYIIISKNPQDYENMSSIELKVMKNVMISTKDASKYKLKEGESLKPSYNNPEYKKIFSYVNHSYDIYKSFGFSEDGLYSWGDNVVLVYGSVENYEKKENLIYGNANSFEGFFYVDVNLVSDKAYKSVINYLKANSDKYTLLMNYFDIMSRARSILSIVTIAGNFINALIVIIAIVNLVNVISTSIINRKSELASMRCIGMTDGQLYRMIATECFQYSLIGVVLAAIICVLLLYGTRAFMIAVELVDVENIESLKSSNIYNFIGNLSVSKIVIAGVASMIVSGIASYIPLKSMRNTSLVEQIRSVE